MTILIDGSAYYYDNLGDCAMLRVAYDRVQRIWPDAKVSIFSNEPERLARICPRAIPVSTKGKDLFLREGNLLGRLYKRFEAQESFLRTRLAMPLAAPIRSRLKLQGLDGEAAAEFVKTVGRADVVLAVGGGYLTDPFLRHARKVLELLAIASSLGKPFALLGQGLGPLEDPTLRLLARRVLPRAAFIGLREARTSRPLLQSIGISCEHAVVTGDDAIELAMRAQPKTLGTALGVNVRCAAYSRVGQRELPVLRVALQQLAKRFSAPMVGLPIDISRDHGDAAGIEELIGDADPQTARTKDLDTLLQQVARCRLVITGSYHAGVFALSQGIPVVALSKSPYYASKFNGLRDQFGDGCEVVNMDDSDFIGGLTAHATRLWEDAPKSRPLLLISAAEQKAAGEDMYQQLPARLRIARTNAAGGAL